MRMPVRLAAGRRPFDAVALGLNSVDLLVQMHVYPEPDSKQRVQAIARLPGGQAATAMVACARLGWHARYIGMFGDDDHGAFGREGLRREGVDISASITVPNTPNQFAVILVDATTGSRTVLYHRAPGLTMSAERVPHEAVVSGRVFLVDCHDTAAATAAARTARRHGIPTVIDVEHVRPGIDDLLRETDIIIAAQHFPSQLTGLGDPRAALARMAELSGSRFVGVTLGAAGSLALVDGTEIQTPAFAVPVVDTTGAGDTFRGGFIAGWLAAGDDANPAEVLRYANAVAALKCRALGAREGIPSRGEVEQLLSSRRQCAT